MANNFTNLSSTIISQAALESFSATLTPLRAFATNLSSDAAIRGDKIKVLWTPDQAGATDFTGTYTMQGAEASGIDVPIDKHKFVSWSLSDKEVANQPQISLEMFGKKKGFELAKAVLLDIWSVILAANFGDPAYTTDANLFDSDDVIDISTVCDTAKWSESGRSLILANALHAQLRKDHALKDASAFGGSEVIRKGQVSSLDKFEAIYGSSLVPTNGEKLLGFAVLPDALLVAMRYLQPQEGHKYHIAEPISEPDAGFTMGYRQWYSEDDGVSKAVLECVYGYKTGNGTALKRVVSA